MSGVEVQCRAGQGNEKRGLQIVKGLVGCTGRPSDRLLPPHINHLEGRASKVSSHAFSEVVTHPNGTIVTLNMDYVLRNTRTVLTSWLTPFFSINLKSKEPYRTRKDGTAAEVLVVQEQEEEEGYR